MSNDKPQAIETVNMKSSLAALAEATNGGPNTSEPTAWTLPSGEELLHYALNGGFLAPSILAPAVQNTNEKRNEGKR